MRKALLFLLLPILLFGAVGKVLDQGKFHEMRDSTFILWTSRIHSDSTLDTIALINKDGIWISYGKFSDSLWAKIIRGEYGVLDSLLADTIIGYLRGKADSAEYADSAAWADSCLFADSASYADSSGWADLLDGYSEDYFLDTNDNIRDSIHASISTDIINPKDSTQITFTDDAVFDSTLFVRIVDYALPMSYFKQYTVTTGSYNTQTGLSVDGGLKMNQWHLDSIVIDSIRIFTYSSADSIALYHIEIDFVEFGGATGLSTTTVVISGDSVNYATGESDYKAKVLPVSSGGTVEAPFFANQYEPYWHNRSDASITWRIWEWITYLRAFYSK